MRDFFDNWVWGNAAGTFGLQVVGLGLGFGVSLLLARTAGAGRGRRRLRAPS